MHYLGIDQSLTSTGVVVLDDQLSLVDYQIISSDPSKSVYSRSWSILQKIREMIVKHAVNYVGIEGLAMTMKGNATRSLAILQGVIVTDLLFNPPEGNLLSQKALEIISPSQLKKFATGNGKANKADMIKALPPSVIEEMKKGVAKKSINDLADAYFLARYLHQFHYQISDFRSQKNKKSLPCKKLILITKAGSGIKIKSVI